MIGSLVALAFALVIGQPPAVQSAPAGQQAVSDHLNWLTEVIRQMEAIKPGMTRADLMIVFTTEGGYPAVRGRYSLVGSAPTARLTCPLNWSASRTSCPRTAFR